MENDMNKMTEQERNEVRKVFNQARDMAMRAGNMEAVDRIEICREMFTNPAFRAYVGKVAESMVSR
jgi:hypothetical protein